MGHVSGSPWCCRLHYTTWMGYIQRTLKTLFFCVYLRICSARDCCMDIVAQRCRDLVQIRPLSLPRSRNSALSVRLKPFGPLLPDTFLLPRIITVPLTSGFPKPRRSASSLSRVGLHLTVVNTFIGFRATTMLPSNGIEASAGSCRLLYAQRIPFPSLSREHVFPEKVWLKPRFQSCTTIKCRATLSSVVELFRIANFTN